MKKAFQLLFIGIFLIILALLSGNIFASPSTAQTATILHPADVKTALAEPAETSWYTVTRVIDGDTAVAVLAENEIRLRFIGIDTPETVAGNRPTECFGPEASQRAKVLLEHQKIRIETDPTQATFDKYGRMLVYAYLEDGTFFNELMIKDGYASEYTYANTYRYQERFRTLEAAAKAAHLGLWKTCST